MSTSSLSPADRAAQTAGVIRQLLGAWLLFGLLWFVIFVTVDLPSFVEFLLLSSAIPLGGLSVFLWRAFIAYRDTVQ